MAFWKVLLLGLFVFLCYPVAQGTNSWAAIATVGFILGGIALYFMPTVVAMQRDHPQRTSIAVLNLLLGWTVIGWVGALAWSYSQKTQVQTEVTSMPEPKPPAAPVPTAGTKTCPYCAEEIKIEAIKCKHCGSMLSAA